MSELNEYWSAQAVTEYKGMMQEQMMQNYVYQCERMAPHVIHNATVVKAGNLYCCYIGNPVNVDEIECIKGFGRTPREACNDFDTIWETGCCLPVKLDEDSKIIER